VGVSPQAAPRARRPFVSTPHHTAHGRVEAVVPKSGPCGDDGDGGAPCRIGRHHQRRRKTGPAWGFVEVAYCAEHELAFTLYPPGHVPYGRVPWVDLAPDGSEVQRKAVAAPGPAPPPVPPSSSPSLFTAAADAAAGERWQRDTAPDPPDAVLSTQRRRVTRAAGVFGLVAGLPPGAQSVAAVTQVPAGQLAEAAGGLTAERGLCVWGREVTRVLAEIAARAGRVLMDRLAVLGHLAGLWGRPYRFLPRNGRLFALGRAFWTGAAPGMRGQAPPAAEGDPAHDLGPRGPP
jgi:hypothetical protein